MANYSLPYGKNQINFALEKPPIDVILPADVKGAPDPLEKAHSAIRDPLGDVNYQSWRGAKSIAIAINDKTRPVPLQHLIPPLLEKLHDLAIPNEAVTFLIATGTHNPVSQAEIAQIVPPEILTDYRVLTHDCDDHNKLSYLGQTSRGTPIWINSIYTSADVKIVVGDIEPHHFMGFSGGAKGAAIGLAGRETVNANHAMLLDPLANIAIYLENPMRQDLEEIGDRLNIDLVLNAVLNHHKEIVEVFAGRPREVMQVGIPLSMQVCTTTSVRNYDIVIASAGGYPKDINLYQSQKAISHAALFARQGGTIIIAAECSEGSGSKGFESFIIGLKSFDEVEEKFKQTGFQIGPHKAYQLARQASQFTIYLLTAIPANRVRQYLLAPITDIQDTVYSCIQEMSSTPRIALIPYATTTLPNSIYAEHH